jgi:hypothetical protein
VIDLSRYILEALRNDEEFVLYRGQSKVDASQILVLSPAVQRSTPKSLKRLEHEYSLKEELDRTWAARPMAIARHWDRTVLVLEDPGGVVLSHLLGHPLDMAFALRVAIKSGEWIRLLGTRDGVELSLEGTHLLVAGGRTPNTSGIGLEKAGVETTDRGHVKVNERLQTTAEGVWAVGDCAGSPHFTHISENDFAVVSDNIAGGHRVTTGRPVPFCMFTDPELARIGLSEREAKQRGISYRLAKLPMASVFRAMTISETRGFMKALIDTESDRIIGFTMFGTGAGEVMATVQMTMLAGLPYTALRDAVIAHPTMPEGLIPLLLTVPAKTS